MVKANYNRSGLNSEKPFWSFCYGKKYLLLMHEYEEVYDEGTMAFSRDLPASCILEAGGADQDDDDVLDAYSDHRSDGDDSRSATPVHRQSRYRDRGGSGGGGMGSGGSGGGGMGSGGGGMGSSGSGSSGSGRSATPAPMGSGMGSSMGSGMGSDRGGDGDDSRSATPVHRQSRYRDRGGSGGGGMGRDRGGDGGAAKRARSSKTQIEAQRHANAVVAEAMKHAGLTSGGDDHAGRSETRLNRAAQIRELLAAEKDVVGSDEWSAQVKLRLRDQINTLMELQQRDL